MHTLKTRQTSNNADKKKAEKEERQLMLTFLKNANDRISESAANLEYLDQAIQIIGRPIL